MGLRLLSLGGGLRDHFLCPLFDVGGVDYRSVWPPSFELSSLFAPIYLVRPTLVVGLLVHFHQRQARFCDPFVFELIPPSSFPAGKLSFVRLLLLLLLESLVVHFFHSFH